MSQAGLPAEVSLSREEGTPEIVMFVHLNSTPDLSTESGPSPANALSISPGGFRKH